MATKPRVDQAAKLGKELFPDLPIRTGEFKVADVANWSMADQRDMLSLKRTKTIRRKPKIDELVTRKVINEREAAACEWYRAAHAMRYDTIGVTMRYGAGGGNGCVNYDHLPKSREQEEALIYFTYAREGINPFFLPMFERIVLEGRPLGKLAIVFRTAARELLARIEDRVAL